MPQARSALLSIGTVMAGCLLLSGCYASRELGGPAGRDGGILPSGDASTVRDGGPPPRRDAGRPLDAGLVCSDVVPRYVGAACSSETLRCVETCGDDEDCAQGCYDRDPACIDCIYTTIIACANRAGCQRLWDDAACCARADRCPAASGPEVIECALGGSCETALSSWNSCADERTASFTTCDGELSTICAFGD